MLIKAFEKQVKKRPGKIAVKSGENALSYHFLDNCANQLANIISEKCKYQPIKKTDTVSHKTLLSQGCEGKGHRHQPGVALLLGHDENMIVSIIGVLKSGGVYIPFDPTYPEERLQCMLADSGAVLMVANNETIHLAINIKNKMDSSIPIINLDQIEKDIPVKGEYVPAASGQIAYILYTSGSTGKPKGVAQTHENILYYIKNWTETFSISDSGRIALFASFSHDGSVPDVFSALLNGATLYPFDIKRNINIIKPAQWLIKEKITIWHSVPTLYRYFVNTLTGEEEFYDLGLIILGGEPVIKHDLMNFKQYFPYSTFGNIYGQTESTVSSIWLVSPGDDFNKIVIGESIGNTGILVIDEEGGEVEDLEVGEIVLASHYLSPGYLNQVETTHNVFSYDPEMGRLYWTGDLGRPLPNGDIEILGRKDHQVKIRGFRIEPGEIETVLLQHPYIDEAVVVARASNRGNAYHNASSDHSLWAYLALETDFNVSQLREYLSKKLPDYMIPSYFVKLETLPFTLNGKVDRKALDSIGITLGIGVEYTPPKNKVERILTDIWQELLHVERIGIHDNFFDLGGNSMDVIHLNNRLKESFNREIPLVAIYRYLTIHSFAQFLIQEKEYISNFENEIDRREEVMRGKHRLKERIKRLGGLNA